MSAVSETLTPPFYPRKPSPDLGVELLTPERYFSPEFMRREWTHMWTKVWNMAVRESEIPEVGDFAKQDLGTESFIFVRGQDKVIRGFYNVCQHRGNRLCKASGGSLRVISCPYHGWQWKLDGSLRKVADPHFFRQFDAGVPSERLALSPIRVDIWGGWVWFNLNSAARPLKEYLGELGKQLEPYEFEKWDITDFRTFEWDCNWKHAVDAFNESYHFIALHPQTAGWAEGYNTPNEILGIHNRMLQMIGTVSVKGPTADELNPALKTMMKTWLQIDPETYTGSAKDVYLEVRRRKRAVENQTHLPYRRMNDEQLSDLYHYTLFPNFIFNIQPEFGFFFRVRPHETDPGRCYFDHYMLQNLPPGSARPEWKHRQFRAGEVQDYFVAFENKIDETAAEVIAQDAANLNSIQRGCMSESFHGGNLCEQEIGVRHFHQVLDSFLLGQRTG